MDVLHLAVVLVALVALASLPCLIAWLILNADDAVDRAGQTMARLRPHMPSHPPVEQTAARLRFLSAHLAMTPADQALRRGELTDRYDATLRLACATLGVPHYLGRLSGTDLDLERLRVEEALTAAGLVVRGPAPGHDTPGVPVTEPDRLFVAFRPSLAAIADLTDYVCDLHVAKAWARICELDLWHVTVAFIGEVPHRRRGSVIEAIRTAAADARPLRLRVAGGGRWGRGRYNVVYAGLGGDVAPLVSLATKVRQALAERRLPFDRKQFRPHLTLAVARDKLANGQSAEDLMSLRRYQGPQWTTGAISLYRSRLRPESHYEEVAEFPLGVASDRKSGARSDQTPL